MRSTGILVIAALGAGLVAGSCRSSSSNSSSNTPEPYRAAKEDSTEEIGSYIVKLDRLLVQWNDAMSKPETKKTLDLRRALAGEIERRVKLRFDELRHQLEMSPVVRNREIVAAAIGFSRMPEALSPLINACADYIPTVREKALLGLSRLKDKNTPVDMIAAKLGPESTDGEQWNASLALKNLAEAGTNMAPALQYLRSGLGSLNPTVRVHCAVAVGHARDAASTPILINMLKDSRPLVAAAAASALGIMGDPETANALIDAMGSQEYAVRTEARSALKRMNNGQDLGPNAGPWRRWNQRAEASRAESRPAVEPVESQPSAALVM